MEQQKPHTPISIIVCTGTAMTMIGIGHYRQNIVATASKSSGIKSLNIIDKRGIDIYSITAKENPKKTGKVI